MIRRVVICIAVALAGTAATVLPAPADEAETHGRDWACVYVSQLETAYCQQNPLPRDLPDPV